uniref:Uncharacterized protein n=1 Tax=Branchiostoma floridae TaxID=7739 RepID=C3XS95_BRAFL|eukprot:XP_002613101.1 hypothetical protein BRAFLDRAFT_89984 [Branchiostoma floridae]
MPLSGPGPHPARGAVGDTTSPMAQRNFPPSFWNSAYQPPTSSLTSPHPDPLHPYTDPYHPHTSALHSHHYNPDPWHPYALGASSQSSYHQPIHHDMYSMASSSHFNPRYSSLLIQPTVRPGRLPAVPGQCDLGKPESAWTRPYGTDQMGTEFPGLGTDRSKSHVWIIMARSRQSARIFTGSETTHLDTTRPTPRDIPTPHGTPQPEPNRPDYLKELLDYLEKSRQSDKTQPRRTGNKGIWIGRRRRVELKMT